MQFQQVESSCDSDLDHYFFYRSKINYLDENIYIAKQDINEEKEKSSLVGSTLAANNQTTTTITTKQFFHLRSNKQIQVTNLSTEYAKHLYLVHNFHPHFYYAFYQGFFLIIEEQKVVLCYTLSNKSEKILDVKFRESNKEGNHTCFYFIISTNKGLKLFKWEGKKKGQLELVKQLERNNSKALQSSLIRNLLCVVWNDGVIIYRITFSQGKIEPISNLLICGGNISCITAVQHSDAEGWIIMSESKKVLFDSNNVSNILTTSNVNGSSDSKVNIIEESNNELNSTSSSPFIFSQPGSLHLKEIDDMKQKAEEIKPNTSHLIYIRITDQIVKVTSEIEISIDNPDLCRCIIDRIQPILYIALGNRFSSSLLYLEYNYLENTKNEQIIQLIAEQQRLLGIDLKYQQNIDNLLMLETFSGEKAIEGGIFFTSISKPVQAYRRLTSSKFVKEIKRKVEDTPETPSIMSPLEFGSNVSGNFLMMSIMKELKEMRSAMENRFDRMEFEMAKLNNRLSNVERSINSSHNQQHHDLKYLC
ncbi:hypothetical protein ABK040_008190 [Willaertia magna]